MKNIPVNLKTPFYMLVGVVAVFTLNAFFAGIGSPQAQISLYFVPLAGGNMLGQILNGKPSLLRWASCTLKLYFVALFLWVMGIAYENVAAMLLSGIMVVFAILSNLVLTIVSVFYLVFSKREPRATT